MCLYHTFNVLECHPFTAVYFFSALWPICRLYTQILRIFGFLSISHSFPMVGHFWPKSTSVTIFFLWPLSLLESCHFFLCVHIPNAIKVTKFGTVPMKLWFLKIQNRNYFGQKWPKSTRGVYIMCVCVCMDGCVLECHPFTAVSFSWIMTELLNGFHIFS